MKNIYLLNEVVGVTEAYKTSATMNVIRDRGNRKCFQAVAYSQNPKDKAVIVTAYHKYTTACVEVAGGKFTATVKNSEAIQLASLLHSLGVQQIVMIDFRYNKTLKKYTIYNRVQIDHSLDSDNPRAEFNQKINEFCMFEKKSQTALAIEKEKRPMDIKVLGMYNIPVPTEKQIAQYNKYCRIYGLKPNDAKDYMSYLWFNNHFDAEFLDGSCFKCKCCGNLVHVDNHEVYINGRYINTHETICECCGEEYDIHDKEDIIEEIRKRG